MQTPQQILKQYWNFDDFRGNQESIIQSVLDGKDTLALLPTGGGKSICFQVPALTKEGLCLVISPLIALMKDQVENLQKKNIAAIALHSGLSFVEVKNILQNAVNDTYKFLYVSPERLESNLFKDYLINLNVNLLAVDEAHCISQWGYDFRPSYLNVVKLRNVFPHTPVIALTASATPKVQHDIIEQLQLKNTITFRQSFERKNISYSIFNIEDKLGKLLSVLQNVPGSSLVYCKSRKFAHKLAAHLQNLGIVTDYYHAGLPATERQQKQEDWIHNRIRVMVCTNAFGMGIDKPDVRSVIHFHLPNCIENYYQEAGRAGRDGKKSFAVLLYNNADEKEFLESLNTRFPSIGTLKHIYQQIANYLNLPIGIGEGNSYDFDLGHFAKTYSLDIIEVINSLKAIEQEGHFTFNEAVFLPSKINFLADKFLLQEIEKNNPNQDAIVKCLLRTYEGIYDDETSISEKFIAKLVKTKLSTVVEILQQLHDNRILDYKPQKTTPQLFFNYNRAPANHITFNNKKYLWRKQQYTQKLQAMQSFLKEKNECRAQLIASYFGDETTPICGICDVCLQKKQTPLTAQELEWLKEKIFAILQNNSMPVTLLLPQLKPFARYKIWQGLLFLQDEKVITIDKFGVVKKYN